MASLLKHFFLALLMGILVLGGYVTWYLGIFKPVTIQVVDEPSFNLLALEHIGPYHLIGPKITQVEDWANAQGLSCRQTFGLYRDDPNEVAHERLTSWGGCILSSSDAQALASLPLPKNYRLIQWKAKQALQASFAGAPSISPYKVYPRMKEFARTHRLALKETPVLEIYPSSKNFEGAKITWSNQYWLRIKNSSSPEPSPN
jgi:hypothetical protein